jgi:hypothetical protein
MDFMMDKIVSFIYLFSVFSFVFSSKAEAGHKINDKQASYTPYVNEIVRTFAKEMKKELALQCIGDGGSMPYDVEEITVLFVSFQKVTVDKARELEIAAIEKLTNIINKNEKIRPYLREYPFPKNRADVRITFLTEKGEYFDKNFVTFVFQTKNQIFYETRNLQEDKFVLLHKESLEEAIKIVERKSI